MKIDLKKINPYEINQAVAEHVAGWKRMQEKLTSFPHETGYWTYWLAPDGQDYPLVPPYWTSAKAVLPLLEKAGYNATGNRCGDTHFSTVVVAGTDGLEHSASSDYTHGENSFTRAACIALLRAAGHEVVE